MMRFSNTSVCCLLQACTSSNCFRCNCLLRHHLGQCPHQLHRLGLCHASLGFNTTVKRTWHDPYMASSKTFLQFSMSLWQLDSHCTPVSCLDQLLS